MSPGPVRDGSPAGRGTPTGRPRRSAVGAATPTLRSLARTFRLVLYVVPAVALLVTLLTVVVDLLTGEVTHSAWEAASNAVPWMMFGVGSMITGMVLPTYLAHGITRRTFVRAAAGAAALLVVLAAFLLATGFPVERALFTGAGRTYQLDGAHLFDSVGQVHLAVLEFTLSGAAYLVSGWLAGLAFYRGGVLRGVLSLPVTLLPALLVDNVLGVGRWLGFGPPTLGLVDPGLPAAAAIGLAAAVIALALAIVHALTRTLPIRHRRPA